VDRDYGDGTFMVSGVDGQGAPFSGWTDHDFQVSKHLPIGARHEVQVGDLGRREEVLVVGRNDERKTYEIEANFDGDFRSGALDRTGSFPRWYPMPFKETYTWPEPINGVTPQHDSAALPGGQVNVTVLGGIIIVHPTSPDYANPADFALETLRDLKTIAAQPSGQALLTAIESPPPGRNPGFIFINYDAGYPYQGADGAYTQHATTDAHWDRANNAPGAGGDSTVFYSPRMPGLRITPNSADAADKMAWDQAQLDVLAAEFGRAYQMPTDVTLYHELVHAYGGTMGQALGFNGYGSITLDEERATGLELFRRAPLTENQYRNESGLVRRPFYSDPTEVYSSYVPLAGQFQPLPFNIQTYLNQFTQPGPTAAGGNPQVNTAAHPYVRPPPARQPLEVLTTSPELAPAGAGTGGGCG
jgi:hypothetical protein